MGSVALNKPIVGMAADSATGGYWLVAADGGIFSFGGAPFDGSTGSIVLNRPIVGMEANETGTGYRFVASDGGIFDFGSSGFFGSSLPSVATQPETAPTPTSTTHHQHHQHHAATDDDTLRRHGTSVERHAHGEPHVWLCNGL